MTNSAQQYANVERAFVIPGKVPEGPVLLIDDLVDSGWTLTVVASLLRRTRKRPRPPHAPRPSPVRLTLRKANEPQGDRRYGPTMTREVTERELRNERKQIVRKLERGESLVVTRAGMPIAELTPVRRRRYVSADTVTALFRGAREIDCDTFRTDLDKAVNYTDRVSEPRTRVDCSTRRSLSTAVSTRRCRTGRKARGPLWLISS